jgi:hypothetical protein
MAYAQLIQWECSDIYSATDCCDRHKDERIPLVICWYPSGEWQVIRSCCKHYHQLKELHDQNLEIYRRENYARPTSNLGRYARTSRRSGIHKNSKQDVLDLLLD